MELNSSTNTFVRGLNLDSDITMIPDGQYRYAENVRLLTNADGTTGILQNIDHIRQYNTGIPSDETIIGTATTRLYDSANDGTIECGIVVTKKIVLNKTYNTIYKVTDFNSINANTIPVVKGYLELENNVSIVTNYESDLVSNIYICDGITPIKVINICDTFEQEIDDPTRFDITPGCILLPFVFQNTIAGALPAGTVQYCYQLFNQNGPETTTSALSELIPITKYDKAGESAKIKGQLKGELSGKGCQIKASFKNDGRFNRARIFSIIYLDNTSIPDIYIINEVEIPNSGNDFTSFTYNDTGASYLSKITIDEFNALVPFEFNAKCVEKLGNRLYAANVQELTWDVEYDARAYRSTEAGYIVLQSSDVSKTITGILNEDGTIKTSNGIIEVPKEHDCINPSNVNVLLPTEYAYAGQNGKRGGVGPNVSYEFVYTEIVLSDSYVDGIGIKQDVELNTTAKSAQIYILDESLKVIDTIASPNANMIIPNYSDPYVCANYLGYQRDEIYRFGIIFYNNKNIPSPVHWIGDVRMPSVNDIDAPGTAIQPFHSGVESRWCLTNTELIGYALGIKFNVKNIPSDVLSYEIVRCDRNEVDRTVVTQGIMGGLFSFDGWGYGGEVPYLGEFDTRPAPMFNLASNFRTHYRYKIGKDDWDNTHVAVKGYFEFVSPEICIAKDTILQNIVNNTLNPLYKVNSITSDPDTGESKVAVPQQSIYHTGEEGLQKNDTNFGLLSMKDGVAYIDMGFGYENKRYGFAGVFKYYNIEYNNYIKQNIQIQDGIISQILPYIVDLDTAKGYSQPIGSRQYVNLSVGGYRQISNHGISAVLQINDITYSPHTDPVQLKDFCTAIITNVKQQTIPYGGNTYISRQSSIYNSCGCFNNAPNNFVYCFGGDTYLCVLDYLNTSVIQMNKNAQSQTESRLCCVNYIPLESQVNLNLRSDESYHRSASGLIGPNLVQNEPIVLPNGYTQKKPYYEYNPVYSSTSGSKQYVPKSIYAVDKQKNQNRIVVSELKTNNEMTDSWTKFKFANYLDVDSQYGQITNLKTFNNKLYFWQDNSVGIAAVNERSLINDNIAELTLGTGGILTRFDYIATLNGSSIVNDKSIVNSMSTIYWYDFDKNEICAMNNSGLIPISKQKNVQSYLNTLPRSAKNNSVSFYDKKYNEVWFRIYDKSLIYNEQLEVFTSFYTHNPNWFFPFSDKLVTIKDNNLYYLHNIYDVNSDVKEERISKIQFVVNKDVTNTKVFDNISFSADLLDNINKVPNIIKDITFNTQKQTTEPFNHFDESKNSANIDFREDTYRFAIPREKVDNNALHQLNSQSYVGRLRGKYLICDYTFDCNNNKEFKLPYIKTTYRLSKI